jgi:hypothetical protein
MEETSLPKTELISGYITIITMILGIICFSTFMRIDENIQTLDESIHQFASNTTRSLIYLGTSIFFLVLLVGMSALYYLAFRFYNPILGSFIAFGYFASAVSLIISSSAALSFHQLLNDFLASSDYESDMIAINMLSVQQMKIKSMMIGGTFFGLSTLIMAIHSYIARITPFIVSLLTGLVAVGLVFAIWGTDSITIIRASVLVSLISLILSGIFLILHSKRLVK